MPFVYRYIPSVLGGGRVNDTAREKDVGFAALDPGVSKWILISVYGGVYW